MRASSTLDASHRQIWATAADPRENLAAYAAEIAMTANLMIWTATINCTLVARDIAMVELFCTLAY